MTASDYITGTLTVTNGSADFTGTGTGWLAAGFKEGDTIIDVTGATEFMGVVATIDANGAGTLTKAWEGPTLAGVAYRMRYHNDGARMGAQARNLIEVLGNGNLQALAGLTGSANKIAMFTGPGAMTLVSKTDLVSGAAYDVQVASLAARAAYDGHAEGYAVLVANVGDGRSAIYAKNSATSADWSEPAYVTGPAITLTVTEVDEVPYGTPPDVTLTPVSGGYDLAFEIPRGMIIEPGTTTTLAPDQPAAVTFVPVAGGYRLDVAIPRGPTGDIDGVTPFWVSRLGSDADAAAARAGLGLVKQTSATDGTAGALLTVGAFGAGKTVSLASPDLSQVRPSGLYYCSSPTNGPPGNPNGWLEVFDLDADYARQEYKTLSTGITWSNRRSGGAWVGWVQESTAAASQAEMEAGASTAVMVTPGRQQFHPSAAKAWGRINYSGGVPSLAGSYGVTSLTDQQVGEARVNLATAFSSTSYTPLAASNTTSARASSFVQSASVFSVFQIDGSTGVLADYGSAFCAFGDQ